MAAMEQASVRSGSSSQQRASPIIPVSSEGLIQLIQDYRTTPLLQDAKYLNVGRVITIRMCYESGLRWNSVSLIGRVPGSEEMFHVENVRQGFKRVVKLTPHHAWLIRHSAIPADIHKFACKQTHDKLIVGIDIGPQDSWNNLEQFPLVELMNVSGTHVEPLPEDPLKPEIDNLLSQLSEEANILRICTEEEYGRIKEPRPRRQRKQTVRYAVRPRTKSITPVRDGAVPQFQPCERNPHVQQQPVQQVQQVQQQQYIQHQGQPHIQQVQHPIQNQVQYANYQHPSSSQVGYVPQQPAPQHIYQQSSNTDQFDSLNSLNRDSLNPSDFSIPSLSEFSDNPGASFPNLSGEDLTNSGYVTAAGHAAAHHHMQFEPQTDGTFDPTSITDQSLDGSAGSNPTTPEKNKSTISPATTPQVSDRPEIVKKPILPLKKYCEICGKEYEGKTKV